MRPSSRSFCHRPKLKHEQEARRYRKCTVHAGKRLGIGEVAKAPGLDIPSRTLNSSELVAPPADTLSAGGAVPPMPTHVLIGRREQIAQHDRYSRACCRRQRLSHAWHRMFSSISWCARGQGIRKRNCRSSRARRDAGRFSVRAKSLQFPDETAARLQQVYRILPQDTLSMSHMTLTSTVYKRHNGHRNDRNTAQNSRGRQVTL